MLTAVDYASVNGNIILSNNKPLIFSVKLRLQMPIQPEEAFKIVNKYLGWGDPNGGLWFIGLEEAKPYGLDKDRSFSKEKFESELKIIKERGEYEILYKPNDPKLSNTKVPVYICKITCCVSRLAGCDINYWDTYRKNHLFVDGKKVFQANLYPLGKKDTESSTWPDHYQECFGYGIGDRAAYIASVKRDRFNHLKSFKIIHNPKAIVCFGKKDGWPDYQELFSLGAGKESVPGKIVVYEEEQIILTPFFGRGMSDKLALEVGSILERWNISIP